MDQGSTLVVFASSQNFWQLGYAIDAIACSSDTACIQKKSESNGGDSGGSKGVPECRPGTPGRQVGFEQVGPAGPEKKIDLSSQGLKTTF